MDVYEYTHRGGRNCNEDCADGCVRETQALFVLADGLGGHRGGERASCCVVHSLMDAWERAQEAGGVSACGWLAEQIGYANERLLEEQKKEGSGMRSTVAALWLDGMRAEWAHVGDSRLYRLTEEGIACLTEDHSVTYRKYRAGEISREEIPYDEDRSALLRVVGDRERCIPDWGRTEKGKGLRPGDGFLLCSDGFWEYLYEEEILIDYLKAESAKEWGMLMLLRVMQRLRPGSDNLTFTAIRV